MTKLKTKPNGVYYIDVEVPSAEHPSGLRRARIGFDTKDQKNAQAQLRDWLAGVHPKHPAMGGVVAPKGRAALAETSTRQKVDTPLVSSWLAQCLSADEVWADCRATDTHRSNVRILSKLIPSDLEIGKLTSAHVEELHTTLKDMGYAKASCRKLLGSLSAAARFAVKKGHLRVMPEFPKINGKNPRDRVISMDEEEVMFQCIAARRAAEPLTAWWHFEQLMVVLLDTGMRLSEAILAGPSWVKRKRVLDGNGNITEGIWIGIPRTTFYKGKEIIVTKNGKPRDVPLTQRVLDILPALKDRSEGTRWFPWALGSSGPLYLLQKIRADMADKGYGFDNVVLHTARHTCATRLAEGGMDLVGLRDFLGHSDIKITAGTYLHLMNGHVFRAAAILNAHNGTTGTVQGKQEFDGAEGSLPDRQPNGSDRAQAIMAHMH